MQWHPWKQVTELLVYERVRQSLHTKMFGLGRVEIEEAGEKVMGHATPVKEVAAVAAQDLLAKAGKAAAPKRKTNSGAEHDNGDKAKKIKVDPDSDSKTQFQKDKRAAFLLKEKALRTLGVHEKLLDKVDNDHNYEWAKNDVQLNRVSELRKSVAWAGGGGGGASSHHLFSDPPKRVGKWMAR